MNIGSPIGCRILVVEDELAIAVVIEEVLVSLGCVVVGPVAKLDAAINLAREAEIDAAVLDVNVRGGEIFPAVAWLRARGIPFVLASGYGQMDLPPSFRGERCLTKPSTCQEIEAEVAWLCRERYRRRESDDTQAAS